MYSSNSHGDMWEQIVAILYHFLFKTKQKMQEKGISTITFKNKLEVFKNGQITWKFSLCLVFLLNW